MGAREDDDVKGMKTKRREQEKRERNKKGAAARLTKWTWKPRELV